MGLAIVRLSSCGRRVVSALMVMAALAMVAVLALETVASLPDIMGPIVLKSDFVVRDEGQLSLYMALGVSVLAMACGLFDVFGGASPRNLS